MTKNYERLCSELSVPKNILKDKMEKPVFKDEKIQGSIPGKTVSKVIVILGELVNSPQVNQDFFVLRRRYAPVKYETFPRFNRMEKGLVF